MNGTRTTDSPQGRQLRGKQELLAPPSAPEPPGQKCIKSNFTKTRKSVGDFVCGIFPPLPELRCCDIWLFKGLDSAEGHHPRDDQEKNRKRRRNGNDDDDG